jgi:hypothetical protein
MMAGPASLFLDNGMDDFLLIGILLVAQVARLRAFRFQEVAPLGGVRVVAGDAFAGRKGGVHPGPVQPDLLLRMAGEAKVVPLFFQEQLGNDPVPEVAVLAFPVFHTRVHAFEGEIFLREFFMAVEASLPLELPLLRPGGLPGSEEGCSREGEDQAREYQCPLEGDGRHTLSRIGGGKVIWRRV